MTPNATYTGFDHEAGDLKKYIEASGLFSLLLKCGKIVHYTPQHADDFRRWLTSHHICNIHKREI